MSAVHVLLYLIMRDNDYLFAFSMLTSAPSCPRSPCKLWWNCFCLYFFRCNPWLHLPVNSYGLWHREVNIDEAMSHPPPRYARNGVLGVAWVKGFYIAINAWAASLAQRCPGLSLLGRLVACKSILGSAVLMAGMPQQAPAAIRHQSLVV